MSNKLAINTSADRATRTFETYENKFGDPIPGHYQYRTSVEVTEFHSDFSEKIWDALVRSGRKNLANKYATDIDKNQRVILFNGEMLYDESTELGRKFARAYGNKLAQIDDFKFPRYETNSIDWWEKSVKEMEKLITLKGWVEINGEKIKPN